MAGKTATLAIKIVSDAKSAGAGFDTATSRLDKMSDRMGKAALGATAVVGGLAAIATEAYKSASELQQSAGAVDAVFGASSAAVHKFARDAAQSVGLAESEYGNLAAVLGSQLANMGYSGDRLAGQVNSLIGLGADLAAQYGGTTADAVEALSSVLKGETDPIERYGVSIKQSDISARLAAEGHAKLTGAAMKAATAQAVLALLADQTKSAVGAFGREADTAAGQTQRAAAEFENAKASLGTALLPVVTEGAKKLSELAHAAGDNQGTAQVLALVIGGLALAVIGVNTALTLYTTGVRIATAAQWLWNAAADANPIMLIVLAILALVAIFVVLYMKVAWVREFIQGTFMALMIPVNLFMGLIRLIGSSFQTVGSLFQAVGKAMSSSLNPVIQPLGWIVDKIGWLLSKGGAVLHWIGGLFSSAGPAGGGGGPVAMAYGAGRGVAAAPVRSAAIGGGGGGLSGGGGGAAGPSTVVTVNVTGAVDPVATGRQLVAILKEYGVATGGQVTVQIGNR